MDSCSQMGSQTARKYHLNHIWKNKLTLFDINIDLDPRLKGASQRRVSEHCRAVFCSLIDRDTLFSFFFLTYEGPYV